MWKYEVLKGVRAGAPKVRKGNGTRVAVRFHTRQLAELTELHASFYRNGVKEVPVGLRLDPLILAVWYVDDGSRCRESDVYLNTQQFNIVSQQVLLAALAALGLSATLNKDKEYRRIRFLKSSIPSLFALIEPHILPSMRYKIGLESVETTRQSPVVVLPPGKTTTG